ncbi:MAG: hypothetical protein QXG48_03985 [Thermofilaceae archaeon]
MMLIVRGVTWLGGSLFGAKEVGEGFLRYGAGIIRNLIDLGFLEERDYG